MYRSYGYKALSEKLESHDETDVDTVVPPELFKLMLSSKVVKMLPCDHVTLRIEWRLRLAQAHDTLHQ